MLPLTLIMLVLSARAGALASRVGPRQPMTFGPLTVAVALLLMQRISTDSTYLTDVLPAVIILGLTLTVAPLTAAVLAAADPRHAGVASGVNNAVARTAGLLAVAVLPIVMGLSGDDFQQAVPLSAGFHRAMLWCAGLVALSAAIAWIGIRDDHLAEAPAGSAIGTSAPASETIPKTTATTRPGPQPAAIPGTAVESYHCALNGPPPPDPAQT